MSSALQLIAIALSIACFLSFFWAIQKLFRKDGATLPIQMKLLSALGSFFFIAQVISLSLLPAVPSFLLQIIGISLFVIGLVLFWWAVPYARRAALKIAFLPNSPTELICDGPYRFVRHPFYASYLLFWVAGVFASQRWVLVVSVIVMGYFYISAMRREESEFLAGGVGGRYSDYMQSVGALVPRLNVFRPRSPV